MWINFMVYSHLSLSNTHPRSWKKRVGPVHCSNPPLRIIWKPQAGPKQIGVHKVGPKSGFLSRVTLPLVGPVSNLFFGFYRAPITPFVTSRGPLCRERQDFPAGSNAFAFYELYSCRRTSDWHKEDFTNISSSACIYVQIPLRNCKCSPI